VECENGCGRTATDRQPICRRCQELKRASASELRAALESKAGERRDAIPPGCAIPPERDDESPEAVDAEIGEMRDGPIVYSYSFGRRETPDPGPEPPAGSLIVRVIRAALDAVDAGEASPQEVVVVIRGVVGHDG